MKVTLTHIGAVSLGRLLAIWSFVLGAIALVLYTLFTLIVGILGFLAGADLVQMLIGIGIMLVMGVVGLVVTAIVMFILGFLAAVVYNIILGVGGGIDMDFRERN
ncbi:hypothetical protein L0Y65_00780 [Candidatus Micrarchaeota archaeon]|nr:hypothetical protein [Candidatus Micrarchaeota archaeon]